MMTVHLTREKGAHFLGISTNGDHGVDAFFKKAVPFLGRVGGKVDADFIHHTHCERVHGVRGMGAGTGNVCQIGEFFPQNSFRHMAAAGVSGAKNQNMAEVFFGEVHDGEHPFELRLGQGEILSIWRI